MTATGIVNGSREWDDDVFALVATGDYFIFTQALLECGFKKSLVDEGIYFLESARKQIEIKVDTHTGTYRIINFQTYAKKIEESDNLFNEIRSAWRQVRKPV